MIHLLWLSITLLGGMSQAAEDKRADEAWKQLSGRLFQVSVRYSEEAPDATRMIFGNVFAKDDAISICQNQARLTIAKGEFKFVNGSHARTVRVTLQPDKKPPTIDFQVDHDKTLPGLYEFVDGSLRIAIGSDGKRPKSLDRAAEQGSLFITFSTLPPPPWYRVGSP